MIEIVNGAIAAGLHLEIYDIPFAAAPSTRTLPYPHPTPLSNTGMARPHGPLRVVVGVDSTDGARMVFDEAARIFDEHTDAKVTLLHIGAADQDVLPARARADYLATYYDSLITAHVCGTPRVVLPEWQALPIIGSCIARPGARPLESKPSSSPPPKHTRTRAAVIAPMPPLSCTLGVQP